MDDLSDLILEVAYHKGRDDIARDFYLPCMQRSERYDRAVGYFRSTIFVVAWSALKGFVTRGGRMRILCSQVLADEDVEALERGYAARADGVLGHRLREEIASLLNDPVLREPAIVLAGLVAEGILEFQVAILRESQLVGARLRIFHDKLGIFHDRRGNRVVFKGSMNETWSGLATDGNLESVDVAASWLGGRDLERCDTEQAYFDELWSGNYPKVLVRPFPQVAREELTRAAPGNLNDAMERLSKYENERPDARGRVLKSHQSLGLASWSANGRKGILAFATGAGKTFTAIVAIREAIVRHGEVVLVVVPDRTLFHQWDAELRETTSDLKPQILRAGAGYSRWPEHLREWTQKGSRARIILATLKTASSVKFLECLSKECRLMIVADEVHRLGAPQSRQLMSEDGIFGARLGLSATPERYGDPDGTTAIRRFFGPVLTPRYELADAIRDGVLIKYFYRPHALRLEPDEAASYQTASREIARLRARTLARDASPNLSSRLQQALFARARLVKQARAKVGLAVQIMRDYYRPGERWLVYCDNGSQLEEINQALQQIGITTLTYHSAMDGDRAATLRWLQIRGGVMTAIKCLDEGVDVPSITHALILASSKNPREFIQRRGRVLRRAEGKALAYIHDAIVLPPVGDGDNGSEAMSDAMTAGELARAIEFASFASNPGASTDLELFAAKAGIDWSTLRALGEENEED